MRFHRCLRHEITLTISEAADAIVMLEQPLFHHVLLPAVIVDPGTLAILDANDTAVRYYGYSRAELLQKTLRDISAPPAPGDVEGAPELLSEHQPRSCRQRARGGRTMDVEAYWQEMVFDGRRAVLGLMLDVSQHKQTEHALRREAETMARGAQVAVRVKDEFLATLSHELRTPLNAILGWTQTLQSGSARKETVLRALAQIEQSARAQARLIDDLLNVSDMVAGRLRLDVQPMRLTPTINAALGTLAPAIDAKEILLVTSFDPAADVVSGDPARMRQVIWNLLSNAVKFTPRFGQIRLTLARMDSKAVIAVSDTGEGINPEFLPCVFDRFLQADGSSRKRHGGLGLGLAIVRHLVEMHGGTVEAHSEGEGRGSTFSVYLPMRTAWDEARGADAEDSIRAAGRAREHQLTGLRILTVDDDRNTREMLQEALEHAGAQVLSAESAQDALGKLKNFLPDVLVSDIGMPNEDGYDLLRQVRVLPREQGGATPAIALTGYAGDEDRTATRNAGYQAVTPKPVNLDELLSTIAVVAEQHPRH